MRHVWPDGDYSKYVVAWWEQERGITIASIGSLLRRLAPHTFTKTHYHRSAATA